MKVIVLLTCVLAYFAYHDLRMRLVLLFCVHRAPAYVQRQAKQIIRMLFALAKFFVDFRVLREANPGLSLPRQFLLISNHQSLLDIPVLFLAFSDNGLRFVGKKALFHYIILLSVMLRIQRHAKIDRKRDFANTLREIERLGKMAAKDGYTPVVFPEGTRTRTGALGDFHSGAVRTILRTTSFPVVSVAVEGGYKASRLRQFLTNLEHMRYHVKPLSIYPTPKSKADIDRVLEAAHAEIADQILKWRSLASETVPV